MKTLALITTALTLGVLGCSNPYERDNPTDPIFVYTVTFNASDATSGTPPAAVSGSWGDVVTLPDGGSLARSGYAFGGWADPAANKNYPIGSTYTITGNAAVNVRWLPAYTVTFDGNGATSGTPPTDIKFADASTIKIPDGGSLQRSNYLLVGWNANTSGTGTSYKIGFSYNVANNITLYAVWIPYPDYNSETHYCDERDGQVYRITTIGTQVWMAENLNYDAEGSTCSKCNIYGRLYNWATAMGFDASCNSSSCLSQVQSKHKGVCPNGWHISSENDWDILVNYVGGYSNAGTKLKAKSGWKYNEYYKRDGNGTDDYGFTALPDAEGILGSWWCATEYEDVVSAAIARHMSNYENSVSGRMQGTFKSGLLFVRCLKD